ncbi:MAG: ABC transporter ATP-binding protein [Coprobacillus sp.]
MLKLWKYIRKFWVPILFSIGFIFVQSQTELSLPDMMSNIVTIGIQSNGFDGATSDVLTEESYNHLMLFIEDKTDQDFVKNAYVLTQNKDLNQSYKDKFEKLGNQNLYVLKDDVDEEKLGSVLTKPMLMISQIDSLDPSSDEYKKMFANLPTGVTPYQALAMMNSSQRAEMFKDVDTKMEAMGESTMQIAASSGPKLEYEKLGADINKVQMDYIFVSGVKMLGIALLSASAAICAAYLSSKVGSGVARNLRKDVFKKVESFSNEEMNKFSTASLITRSTNDITQVQMVVIMCLRIVCFAPMMGIGALLRALNNSASMTWIIALVLVVIIGLLIVTFAVAMPKFKIIQKLIDKLNLSMRENLSGMLVIRAFGNEKHSEERFDVANNDLTKVNMFVNKTMASVMPIMMLVMNVVTILVVWYGAKQIDLGTIAIGQMMAFIQYSMQIIMSFLMIAMIAIMLPRASVSGHRVYEVLSTEPQIVDPKVATDFNREQKGYIDFDHVTFNYPGADEPVLNDITFTARPGETTAFIGSTGSGKSTLINLIPRFYEVTSGAVRVDGVDVREVNQHELREKIGLVPQKGLLFSGTIRSNLAYGAQEATDEELNEAARIAQASEFIEQKDERLDTEISQGGTNVSGGQKQRLAIARAIAKKPDIFIFDDSFSALDFKTDAVLRKELNKLTQKTKNTVLIVGQRIASIMSADQIIVLDQGKIVGKGTHDELMKDCQVYQEIAYSQLSKEELGHE